MGSTLTAVAVAAAAFVVMEPVTALVHRHVMHGIGMAWHRSHHQRWGRRAEGESWFERNDRFPLLFAGVTVTVMAVAFQVPSLAGLLPVTVGITLYGGAYLFVHDLYIHRRLPRLRWHTPVLDRLADAHALHHRHGAGPYGMLLPVVPARTGRRVTALG